MKIIKSEDKEVKNFAVITDDDMAIMVNKKPKKSYGCAINMIMCDEFDSFIKQHQNVEICYFPKSELNFSVIARQSQNENFIIHFKIVENNNEKFMLSSSSNDAKIGE